MGRADGVSDAEFGALPDFRRSPLFDDRCRSALAYADAVTTETVVPDPTFEALRRHFTEDEIVELTAAITWEICAAKFNRALEIESQGVCRVASSPP